MDELVPVVSRTEDEHGRTVGDELEQHAEDPEATVAEDRPGPDDGHVEARGDRLATQHLGLELGPPVRLERTTRGLLGDGVGIRDPEHRARRRVHDLADAGVAGGDEQVRRADHVHRPEQLAVARQRHLRDIVQHQVDAVARGADRVPVPHVSLDELDRGRRGGGGVQVEDPDPVTIGDGAAGEDLAEVAAPARDED